MSALNFVITFLEGIISFISPCMLPMLPLYITYFAGSDGKDKKHLVFIRALAFVAGFTVIYAMLGLSAGFLSGFLSKYKTAVNIVSGLVIIFFGVSYLGVIKLSFLKGVNRSVNAGSVFSAFLFGVIYSVSLTPCVGAFLGSALMMAANSGTALHGVLLLIAYSLGLGVPFLVSAVLIDKLRSAFSFIKKHYKVINTVCGIFLIVVGIFMAAGLLDMLIGFIM